MIGFDQNIYRGPRRDIHLLSGRLSYNFSMNDTSCKSCGTASYPMLCTLYTYSITYKAILHYLEEFPLVTSPLQLWVIQGSNS